MYNISALQLEEFHNISLKPSFSHNAFWTKFGPLFNHFYFCSFFFLACLCFCLHVSFSGIYLFSSILQNRLQRFNDKNVLYTITFSKQFFGGFSVWLPICTTCLNNVKRRNTHANACSEQHQMYTKRIAMNNTNYHLLQFIRKRWRPQENNQIHQWIQHKSVSGVPKKRIKI